MGFENIERNALTKQLKSYLGKTIQKVTGMSPFRKTKQGGDKINTNALIKFKKTKAYQRLRPKTKRRITLAINFEKFRKDRKSSGRNKGRGSKRRTKRKSRRGRRR